MFKIFCLITLAVVALPLAAQLVTAPPPDRLELAIQLSKRGMHAEALREFEAIRNAKGVPHDEVLFRLGDTYRILKRPDDARNCYAELIDSTPSSRYADVARLNRAMLRTGEAPQSAHDIVKPVHVLNAIEKSYETGARCVIA